MAVWKIAPIKAPTGRTIITSAKEAACRVALMTTTKEELGTGRRPYCGLPALSWPTWLDPFLTPTCMLFPAPRFCARVEGRGRCLPDFGIAN